MCYPIKHSVWLCSFNVWSIGIYILKRVIIVFYKCWHAKYGTNHRRFKYWEVSLTIQNLASNKMTCFISTFKSDFKIINILKYKHLYINSAEDTSLKSLLELPIPSLRPGASKHRLQRTLIFHSLVPLVLFTYSNQRRNKTSPHIRYNRIRRNDTRFQCLTCFFRHRLNNEGKAKRSLFPQNGKKFYLLMLYNVLHTGQPYAVSRKLERGHSLWLSSSILWCTLRKTQICTKSECTKTFL